MDSSESDVDENALNQTRRKWKRTLISSLNIHRANIRRIEDTESDYELTSSKFQKFSENSKGQWHKVLGTFDPVKHIPFKKKRQSKKSKIQTILSKSYTRIPLSKNINRLNLTTDDTSHTSTVSAFKPKSYSTAANNVRPTKSDGIESEIVWSSSNEESDFVSEADENEKNFSYKKFSKSLKRDLSKGALESQIVWSSSDDTEESQNNVILKISPPVSQEISTAEKELNLFLHEIQKDFRRTEKIKQKLPTKKDGYLSNFRKAIEKTKTDVGFLDYELRTGIVNGSQGCIIKKETSYGVCAANVKLENGTQCCFYLDKSTKSVNVGTTLISFVDLSNAYTVRNCDTFVQPNKILVR